MYNCIRLDQNTAKLNGDKVEGYKPEKKILTWLSQQGQGTLERSR